MHVRPINLPQQDRFDSTNSKHFEFSVWVRDTANSTEYFTLFCSGKIHDDKWEPFSVPFEDLIDNTFQLVDDLSVKFVVWRGNNRIPITETTLKIRDLLPGVQCPELEHFDHHRFHVEVIRPLVILHIVGPPTFWLYEEIFPDRSVLKAHLIIVDAGHTSPSGNLSRSHCPFQSDDRDGCSNLGLDSGDRF
jgi:hypothetical protein